MSHKIVLKKLSACCLPLIGVLAVSARAGAPADLSGLQEDAAVSVREGDTWSPATFERKEGHKYLIKYADGTEEWVTAERLRLPDHPAAPAPSYQPGQKLQAKWYGQWKPCVVVRTQGDWTLVSYTEVENWDEWVEPWRLRAPGTTYDVKFTGANPRAAVGQAPPRAAVGSGPSATPTSQPTESAAAGKLAPRGTVAANDTGRILLPVADTWAYTPAAPAPFPPGQPLALPAAPRASVRNVSFSGPVGMIGIEGAQPGYRQPRAQGLIRANVVTRSVAAFDLPADSQAMAISPKGLLVAGRSIAPGDFKGFNDRRSVLDIFHLAGSKATPIVSFQPDAKSEIRDVYFLDEQHVVAFSGNELACWDLETATSEWRIACYGAARSPDGKTAAVSTSEGIALVDLGAGKVLGLISDSQVNRLVSFSSDGKQLFGLNFPELTIYDLQKGQPLYSIAVPSSGGMLIGVEGDNVLLGDYLFSVSSKAFVWRYESVLSGTAYVNGRCYSVVSGGKFHALVGAAIPHPAAVAAIKQGHFAPPVLHPGMSVSLDMQEENTDEGRKKLADSITQQLAKADIKIEPNQPVVVRTKTTTSESHEEEYLIRGGKAGFDRRKVTVSTKVYALVVEANGRVVWQYGISSSTSPGTFVTLQPGETLEGLMKKNQYNGAASLLSTRLPRWIAAPADLKLPSSRLTIGGFKDQ